MAQVINTNISSLNAQRNLNTSQSALATSLQRLSSGLRINSAKDDAAGLAISDRMTSQIRGLNQAARNANDGVSLAQTAEGGLSEVASNLQRIRELAIQSANATNTSSDRASLNAEVTQLLAEIQRVATSSQFNGQNILDGTFTAAQFQVGANANQTITASTGNAQTSAIGAYQYNNTSSAVSGTALASGDLTINGVNVGATANGSADTIVNAINGVTSQTSVTATATSSIVAANAPVTGKQDLASGDLVINGVNIGAVTGSYNFATQGASIATAINAKTNTTGVTASANTVTGAITLSSSTGKTIEITSGSAAGASRVENATGMEVSASTASATQTYTLSAAAGTGVGTLDFDEVADGETFTVGTTTFTFNASGVTGGSGVGAAYTDQASLQTSVAAAINGANIGVTAAFSGAVLTITNNMLGNEAAVTKSHLLADTSGGFASINNTAGTGLAEGSTLIIDNQTYTFIKGATSGNNISLTTATTTTLATALASAMSANKTTTAGTNLTNHTAAASSNQVTATSVLKGSAGNGLGTGTAVGAGVAAAAGVTATDGAYTASTTYGIISLSSNAAYSIAGNDPAKAGLSTASSTLNAANAIDISSVAGANSAISVVDGALSQVATIRGAMGALQNRFQSVVSSLTASSENLSAARSRIQDADFAAETAQLTRN
ncbi:MAG: flagellin, partial [Rhodocyclaceae bacterium]|nr:flagellin [Rhodocyclaceae bacterium]